jgi:hypothetical protein
MAYHNELLSNAKDVLVFKPQNQATLRRAVSTAYYSIFHLLIFESCQLWGLAERRQNLARQFDHDPMRTASRLVYEGPARKYFKWWYGGRCAAVWSQ